MPISRSSILALDGPAFARLAVPSRTTRVRRLLEGSPGKRAREWLGARLAEPAGAAVLGALANEGRLAELLHELGPHRASLYPALARTSPLRTAASKSLLSLPRKREGRLAVHRFFDRLRGEDTLGSVLRSLRPLAVHDPWIAEVLQEASPPMLPRVVGHRGLPGRHPENTMPSLEAAARAGAEGVEIDVSLTRDGRLALWHDANPRSIDAEGRRRGGEKGMLVRPVFPGEAHLRATHLLTLDELRRHYGYAKRTNLTARRMNVTIPTLEDVVAWIETEPRIERVYLDLKLPTQRRLIAKLARRLDEVVPAALRARFVLMHVDRGALRELRTHLGSRFALCYDHVIGGRRPDPDDHSTVLRARQVGAEQAAVGKPFLARKKMRVLTKVLRADRARIAGGRPRELVVWTLNDEVELRRVMGIGVDAIFTDLPGRLRRIVAAHA